MSSTPAAASRKPNRRGVAAREKLLSTALAQLAGGQPESVSINLVAKEAGLSWGSVQNLFGDSDGFWSAVVELILDVGPELWAAPTSDTVAGRLAEVTALYRGVLESPYAIAVETIRAALPKPLQVLAESHPRTAASLRDLDERWSIAFVNFLDGLAVDPVRVRDAAALLQSALRGLRLDQVQGTTLDVDRAHEVLVSALSAYLEG